jgi:hypothetical protein
MHRPRGAFDRFDNQPGTIAMIRSVPGSTMMTSSL